MGERERERDERGEPFPHWTDNNSLNKMPNNFIEKIKIPHTHRRKNKHKNIYKCSRTITYIMFGTSRIK